MGEQLDHLSEADIQARCSETSFERGRGYYKGGAVRQRARLDDGLETRVSDIYAYRVTVREGHDGAGRDMLAVAAPMVRTARPGSPRDRKADGPTAG